MSRELRSPVTGAAATVTLVAAIPLFILACATTSVETTVTRAPRLPVFKSRQVALAPIEVTGSTRFETEFACGGKAAGELGAIPDARRSHYAEGLQTLVRGVLEAEDVQVVGVGEAPQILKLAVTVLEVESTKFKRCDRETSVEGLECLPDPEIDGKTQCGCVAVTEGSLSPDRYHFVVYADGELRIEARTRLESADGGLIAEDTIHLSAPPAFNGGSIPCNHVRGQPERLERCLNAGVSLSSGPVLQEVIPDFEAAFRTVFASATARENGGKSVHEAMFPFEARVRYTIFNLKEPRSVAKPAVRALRSGRFDEAAALFEGAIASVREGNNLPPVARARFIYDYGLSLLGAGKLREAKAAIEEAKAIQQDARFDAALAEIDRQGMDSGALGTAVADAAGANPTATPGVTSAPPPTSAAASERPAAATDSLPVASNSAPSGTCRYEKVGDDPAFVTRFEATVENGAITAAHYLETIPKAVSQLSLTKPSAELLPGVTVDLPMQDGNDGASSIFTASRDGAMLTVNGTGGVAMQANCTWVK